MTQLTALAEAGEQWKGVAYSTGTFASKVIDPGAGWETFERFLYLSKTAGLVVDLEDYLTGVDDVPGDNYYTLLDNLHRVKGLNFVTNRIRGMMRTVPPPSWMPCATRHPSSRFSYFAL